MDKVIEGELIDSPKSMEEKIKLYALHWIATGNKAEAYLKTGGTNKNGAYQFHRAHSKEIDKYVWNNGFKDNVPLAINTLVEMMVNGNSDTAKLKAAIELLDRAGFNKTDKLALKDESTSNLEDQDINRQIQELIKNNPVELKAVK